MLIENNFSSLKAFNKRVLKGFYVSQSELDKVTVFKRSDVMVVQKWRHKLALSTKFELTKLEIGDGKVLALRWHWISKLYTLKTETKINLNFVMSIFGPLQILNVNQNEIVPFLYEYFLLQNDKSIETEHVMWSIKNDVTKWKLFVIFPKLRDKIINWKLFFFQTKFARGLGTSNESQTRWFRVTIGPSSSPQPKKHAWLLALMR